VIGLGNAGFNVLGAAQLCATQPCRRDAPSRRGQPVGLQPQLHPAPRPTGGSTLVAYITQWLRTNDRRPVMASQSHADFRAVRVAIVRAVTHRREMGRICKAQPATEMRP
jgi:hypothetical protein